MKKQLIITGSAAASIFLAIGLTSANMDQAEQRPLEEKKPVYPSVSSIRVSSNQYQSEVKGYGNASARYQLSLTSEVSGQVISLANQFHSGLTVAEDQVLLTLDNSHYQQALASAEADYSQAKVDLLQEQLNRKQAQQEWQRSGLQGQPDSELVLREPQLAAAQDVLNKTEKALKKARRDLQKTQIRSPFSALIINRLVQPGSYIQAGTQIATLYSTDVLDIKIPLSHKQWQQLPPLNAMMSQRWPVTLHSQDGSQQWQGYVSRGEQHLNSDNRQRSLVVSVDQPLRQTPALFPGTFVEAHIHGAVQKNTWQLPASSLTQDQKVWTINNGRLQTHQAELLFANGQYIYIQALSETAEVLTQPLKSYFPQMQVQSEPHTDNSAATLAEE